MQTNSNSQSPRTRVKAPLLLFLLFLAGAGSLILFNVYRNGTFTEQKVLLIEKPAEPLESNPRHHRQAYLGDVRPEELTSGLIKGRVVNQRTGQGVPDVNVEIEIESMGSPRFETEAEAFTDEGGYFVATQDSLLKNLTYRAKLEVKALGYFDNINAATFELSPNNSFVQEKLVAKMAERNATGEITGRVLNQRSGEPVSNATVMISVGPATGTDRQNLEIHTDDTGNFKLLVKDLRFGQDYMGEGGIIALGFAPSDSGFNFKLKRRNKYQSSGHVISLAERNTSGVVKLAVVDGRTGKGIEAAEMNLTLERVDRPAEKLGGVQLKSDANGKAETEISNLRLGFEYKVVLAARANKYNPVEFSEGLLSLNNHYKSEVLTVNMAEKNVSGLISGSVNNKRTGEPIPEALIELSINNERKKILTDAQGNFLFKQNDLHPWEAYKGLFTAKKVGYLEYPHGEVILHANNSFSSEKVKIELPEHNTTGFFGGVVVNERDGSPLKRTKLVVNVQGKRVELQTDAHGRFNYSVDNLRVGTVYKANIENAETKGFHRLASGLSIDLGGSKGYNQSSLSVKLKEHNITLSTRGVVKNERSSLPVSNSNVTLLVQRLEREEAEDDDDDDDDDDEDDYEDLENQNATYKTVSVIHETTDERGQFLANINSMRFGPNYRVLYRVGALGFNPFNAENSSGLVFNGKNKYTPQYVEVILSEKNSTAHIAGFVFNARSREPIPRASLDILIKGLSKIDVKTDERGFFNITHRHIRHGSSYEGTIDAFVEGFNRNPKAASFKLLYSVNYDLPLINIFLEERNVTAYIEGSVLIDRLGLPIEHAEVRIEIEGIDEISTYTDAYGRFNSEVKNLRYGTVYKAEIESEADGYFESEIELDLNKDDNYIKRGIIVRLREENYTAIADGIVVNNRTGEPIPGATVEFDLESRINGNLEREITVVTDNNGLFRAYHPHVRSNENFTGELEVVAYGFEDAESEEFNLTRGNNFTQQFLVVRMNERNVSGTITGMVMNLRTGEPIEDAEVLLRINDLNTITKARSDESGFWQAEPEDLRYGKTYVADILVRARGFADAVPSDNKFFLHPINNYTHPRVVTLMSERNATATIRGQLIDSRTGEPVANADVIIRIPGRGDAFRVTTDDSGKFSIEIDNMRYGLNHNGTIRIHALGYQDVDGLPFQLLNDQDYNFALELNMQESNKTGAIAGKIINSRTGQAIPEASVLIEIFRNDTHQFHSSEEVQSDELGNFFHQIEGLRENLNYFAQLTVDARGYSARNDTALTYDLTLPNLFRHHDIIVGLEERNVTLSVRGRVVNERTEEPLTHANILLELQGHFEHETFGSISLRTDASGVFHFQQPDIRHGFEYMGKIIVSARSFVTDSIEELEFNYDNEYQQNDLLFKLEERNVTGKIEGRILNDRTGKPLEEAKVSINIGGKIVEVETDEDGRFSYEEEDLRHGLSYATQFNAGLSGFYHNVDSRDVLTIRNEYKSENVTIRLRERNVTAEISGLILNQRSLKPLSSAEVKIELDGKMLEVLTDSKGRFTIHQEHLRHGQDYEGEIGVRADGFFPQDEVEEFELDTTNNYQRRNVVVKLAERNVTAKISGKVINERTKKPLRNAEVEVSIGGSVVKVKTDIDGEFVVLEEDLRHGADYEAAINVKADGFHTLKNGKEFRLETENDYRKNELVIKMKERNASIIVTGRVINNRTGLPVANATTELDVGEDFEYEVQTDEDGNFFIKVDEFSYGPTYEAEVEVETPGFIEADDGNEFVLGPLNGYVRNGVIIKIDEETEKIQFKLKGRIVDPESKRPVSGAHLKILLGDCCIEQALEAKTDRAGRFEIEKELNRLLARTEEQQEKDEDDGAQFGVKFKVERGGYLSRIITVNYKEGDDKSFEREDLQIYLSRYVDLKVEGKIEDIEGSPVAGATVSLDCGGVIKNSRKATGFGLYEFEFLRLDNELLPVDCRLWASAKGYQSIDETFHLEKSMADNRELLLKKGEDEESESGHKIEITKDFKTPVLYPRTSARVFGRILDEVSKEGVENVQVHLVVRELVVGKKMTGFDGRFDFEIQVFEGDSYLGEVSFEKIGFTKLSQHVLLDKVNKYSSDLGNILLASEEGTFEVVAKVADVLTHRPVANAQITFKMLTPQLQMTEHLSTDAQGNVVLRKPAKRGLSYTLLMSASQAGYTEKNIHININERSGFVQHLPKILLERPSRTFEIQGNVAEEDSVSPMTAAKVKLTMSSPTGKELILEAMPNEKGNFKFSGDVFTEEAYQCKLSVQGDYLEAVERDIILSQVNTHRALTHFSVKRKSVPFKISGVVKEVLQLVPIQLAEVKLVFTDVTNELKIAETLPFKVGAEKAHPTTKLGLLPEVSTVATDSLGAFEFQGVLSEGNIYKAKVVVSKGNNHTENAETLVLSPSNNYKVNLLVLLEKLAGQRLKERATLTAFVLEARSKASLKDATVIVDFDGKRTEYLTGKEGKFEFTTEVEKGTASVAQVTVAKKNYLTKTLPVEFNNENQNQVYLAELPLERDIVKYEVKGILRNAITKAPLSAVTLVVNVEEGQGVAKAPEPAGAATAPAAAKRPLFIVSNADGFFKVSGLIWKGEKVRVKVATSAASYAVQNVDLALSQNNNYMVSVDPLLEESRSSEIFSFKGRILDSKSKAPVPNVAVVFRTTSPQNELLGLVETGPDGVFRASSTLLKNADYILGIQISHPDYQNVVRTNLLSSRNGTEINFMDVSLERQVVNYVVTGALKDANTGLPIVGTEFSVAMLEPVASKPILVKSGDKGHFFSTGFIAKGLSYKAKIFVTTSTHEDYLREVELNPLNEYLHNEDILVSNKIMSTEYKVKGRAVDMDTGRAVHGARVDIQLLEPKAEPLTSSRSDTRGFFEKSGFIQKVPSYTAKLTLLHDDFQVVTKTVKLSAVD